GPSVPSIQQLVVLAAVVACTKAGFLAPAGVAYSAPLSYSPGPAVHSVPVAHAVHAAPVAYAAAPVAKAVIAKTVDEEYDPNPQYSYSYDVHDGITGDAKTQQETRNGDQVQGSYSLLEADGTRRIVEYTADPQNGFNAVVHKEPATVAVKAVAPVVAKVHAAPVAYAAPAAPVAYAAPAASVAYAAPAAPVAYAAPAAPAAIIKSHNYY
ncbi:PREDICTED: cuticle protein 21-like, partial [Ceratosolen solmsi marchali]|uniref:Cuticle protein 21-like n=1 Tax=Ceratosolen solmsi marchali TaxID=326594 RepID=A0AAJ6YHE3_9HYME